MVFEISLQNIQLQNTYTQAKVMFQILSKSDMNTIVFQSVFEFNNKQQQVNNKYPIPQFIDISKIIFSVQLYNQFQQSTKTYNFSTQQQNQNVSFQNDISFNIKINQQAVNTELQVTSIKSVYLHIENQELPISKQNLIQKIQKQVIERCNEQYNMATTFDRQISLFSNNTTEKQQVFQCNVIILPNTSYITQVVLFKQQITNTGVSEKNFKITKLTSVLMAMQDLYNFIFAKTQSYTEFDQILLKFKLQPQLFYDHLVNLQNTKISDQIKTIIKDIYAYYKLSKSSINQAFQMYEKFIKQLQLNTCKYEYNVQNYTIFDKQLNEIVNEPVNNNNIQLQKQINQRFQQFLQIIQQDAYELILLPLISLNSNEMTIITDQNRFNYVFQILEQLNSKNDIQLLDIINYQPVMIRNFKELIRVQLLNINIDIRKNDLKNILNTKQTLLTEQQNLTFLLYFKESELNKSTIQPYKMDAAMIDRSQNVQIIDETVRMNQTLTQLNDDQISQLEMYQRLQNQVSTLQKVVNKQNDLLLYNQKNLNHFKQREIQYKNQLNENEVKYIDKNLRLKNPDLINTIDDCCVDLMKTYNKQLLSKILLESICQQFHQTNVIMQNQQQLRTEEKKLLDDQQQLIKHIRFQIQQIQRRKIGVSVFNSYQTMAEVEQDGKYKAYGAEKAGLPQFDSQLPYKQGSILHFENKLQQLPEQNSLIVQQNSLQQPSIQQQIIAQYPLNYTNLNDQQQISVHQLPSAVNSSVIEQKSRNNPSIQPVHPSSLSMQEAVVERPEELKRQIYVSNAQKSNFRQPPQILPNTSQASRFLSMNMK